MKKKGAQRPGGKLISNIATPLDLSKLNVPSIESLPIVKYYSNDCLLTDGLVAKISVKLLKLSLIHI